MIENDESPLETINKFKCVTDNNVETIVEYLRTVGELNFKLAMKCCDIIDIFQYLDIDILNLRKYVKKIKNNEEYQQLINILESKNIRQQLIYDFLNKNINNKYCLTKLHQNNINFNNVLVLNLNNCMTIKNGDIDVFINLFELNMENCN